MEFTDRPMDETVTVDLSSPESRRFIPGDASKYPRCAAATAFRRATAVGRSRSSPRLMVASTLWGLVLCSSALAQSVELQFSSTTLEVGETMEGQLVFANTGVPDPPQISGTVGLELRLVSTTPSASTFMSIVNGRGSQTTKYTYTVRATATKVGNYKLGPFVVTAGGQSLQTEPVQVSVRKSTVTSGSNGDRFVFAELEVQPLSLYVTQTFRATLTVGVRKVEIGGRIYNLDNLLRTILDGGASELSVFSGGKYSVNNVSLADSSGKAHPYEVYRIVQDIRAESVGEMSVGPVFLKVNYPTSLQRGWFGDMEIGNSRKEMVRVAAVPVTVKGPPVENRPADFSGAIGQFQMSVTAKPERVEQGQPITLAIAFRGEPLQGLAPPNLAAQPELAGRFEFTRDELAADSEQGAKLFRRAVFPKSPGEQTVPSISWSYFDPNKEQYVTLTSTPIRITVDPPVGTGAMGTNFDEVHPVGEGTKLTLLTGGISPNYVHADSVLASQAFTMGGAKAAVLGLAPLACLVVTLTRRHRDRLRTDVSWARRRGARRMALQAVSRAMRAPDSKEKLHGLAAAATRYLADRFNLPEAAITPADAKRVLMDHTVDPVTVGEFTSFLETCDTLRYAPGVVETLSAYQIAADLRRWMDRMERETGCR